MSNIRSERKRGVACVCPKCGKEYTAREFYTGKEPMKRFCDTCKYEAGSDYSATGRHEVRRP